MKKNDLESRLIEIGYPGLFMYGEQSLADSIWENGENVEQLKGIIFSDSSPSHAKFLAAEVLRYFDVELDIKSYKTLADAYAHALEHTSADRGNSAQLNGNLWGLLYDENDTGYLGKQFIKFDIAAISPLTKLLDDRASRILYEGSQEATIGNAYQYRIKDFAAFYISKIKDIPIRFYQDFKARDKEIERLKGLLKKE
ncbi:MAG: hypothetical protein OEV42_07805 [Deltaproteobacteria bacterium]|nr:hypothetical protein [Deltaproteobacteria bacterium]